MDYSNPDNYRRMTDLELAADLAVKNGRTIVIKDDIEETADAATKKLLAVIE